MTKKVALSLLHTIICDDIRREDNGKLLLIGVYPETVMLNTFPAQLLLSVWLQFVINMPEKFTLEFQIIGEALQEPVNVSLDITDKAVNSKEDSLPVVFKALLKVKSAGTFTIQYRKAGEKTWQLARTFGIKSNVVSLNR